MADYDPIKTFQLETRIARLDQLDPAPAAHVQEPVGAIVGLEYLFDTFHIAVIDAEAAHFPWTEDLHRMRSLRSLERFWRRRFGTPWNRTAPRPIVCIRAVKKPSLLLWLETQGAVVRVLPDVDLQPFYKAAADYEIPLPFRGAHALAHTAATQLRARTDLQVLAATLSEVNLHLQDATKALWRLAAVAGLPAG